jgi:ArsR family transcriptional regulator
LKLLEQGELCVCDIYSSLDMVQPKVSFHLAVLREASLIKDRKDGRWTHYRIDDSDLFRRFVILSGLERIPDRAVADDRKRLVEFLKTKKGLVCADEPAAVDAACCPTRARATCPGKKHKQKEVA